MNAPQDQPSTQSIQPAPKPHRRWRWYHNLCALLALLLLAFLAWHLCLNLAIQAEHAAIRAQGLPVTSTELDAYYTRIPSDQNAALIWIDASASLRDLPDPDRHNLIPYIGIDSVPPQDPWHPFTPEQTELLREYVELNEPSFTLASQAAQLPKARFPADLSLGIDSMLTHLAPHRALARALWARSAHATNNHLPESATESITLLLDLSVSLRNEPNLISQLVMIAEHRLAVQALERTLNHLLLTDHQLTSLQSSFQKADSGNPIHTALIGERTLFRSARAYFLQEMDTMERAVAHLYRAIGIQQLNEITYHKLMQQSIDAQSFPHAERQKFAEQIDTQAVELHRYGAVIGSQILSMANAQTSENNARAQLRTALTALAIERYRLANNQLPETLEQLVPDFLESIPLDPFTGTPLLYTKTAENHYIVYSVGEDLTDNNGARRNPAGDMFEPGSDIVFQVRR